MLKGLLGLTLAAAAIGVDMEPSRGKGLYRSGGERLQANKAKKKRKAKIAYASRRRNSR